MSDNEQTPTNVEEVQNQLISNWVSIGNVTGSDGYKLKMPSEIPASPGVYRIIGTKSGEVYIGEGRDLRKRLCDYQNAGFLPGPKANTNRFVQGWINKLLNEKNDSAQISICTEAHILGADASVIPLDFQQKYFRMLVESLTIFNDHKELTIINKQFLKAKESWTGHQPVFDH